MAKENSGWLDRADSPEKLKSIPQEQLPLLANELRQYILKTVACNGGHLASNLGVVELTVALHYAFDLKKDKIIWDVSHQSYAHKILTGRKEFFSSLRKFDGCCGFQSPLESEYDPCFAGHAGAAISTCLGISAANIANNRDGLAIAVVGDGSLNCGLSLEGLNNAASCGKKLVIILNDNRMSISGNVGAMASYLHRVITARHYSGVKNRIKKFIDKLPGHRTMLRYIRKIEGLTKFALLPGAVFEELGIRYLGPVDGHDIPALLRTFEHIRTSDERPVIIHVKTKKGYGYTPAQNDPESFHGVSSFDLDSGSLKPASHNNFSYAFGYSALELVEKSNDVVAISAAMISPTGLANLKRSFPDRVFDVGIAEGHAVTFAGGLATAGMRPIVAIYATFIQRALDNVFHDVCLGDLPVIFCLDRAGLVEDGPTHNGIYDLSFFRSMPNLIIMQPASENELRQMLFFAYNQRHPVVIRYPRGGSGMAFDQSEETPIVLGKGEIVSQNNSDIAIWASGAELWRALEINRILQEKFQLSAEIVNARFIKPLDHALMLKHAAEKQFIFTIEDHSIVGGLGSAAAEVLAEANGKLHSFGWPDHFIPHGKPDILRRQFGLTADAIAEKIAAIVRQ